MTAMPANRRARRVRSAAAEAGFTLLELIIVIAIIGILATIAMPRLLHTPDKAREAVLKTDLRTFRDVIDQYYADKGHYPTTLDALVDDGYMRKIPIDPFTRSAETWVPVFEEPKLDNPDTSGDSGKEPVPGADPDAGKPGIMDVHSGAEGTGSNGTPYSEW